MKKIMSIMLACIMCVSLFSTTVFAVEDSTNKAYTIDLNKVPEQEFNESKIKVIFEVPDKITVEGNEELGYPIRLDISSLNGGVTFIPLRLIADTLNVPIEWVEKTSKEEAHAVITTANHGTVNFYMGATSITASDGTVYEEETYKFPDGTSIPLILVRNGRLYVPVRFLSTFVLGSVQFEWGANATILYIKGQKDEIPGVEIGYGITPTLFVESNKLIGRPGWENMPHLMSALENVDWYDYAEKAWPSLAVRTISTEYGAGAECNLLVTPLFNPDESALENLEFKGVCRNDDGGKQFAVIEGLLKDTVNAEDTASIMKILNETADKLNKDRNAETGKITDEAIEWKKSQAGKKYEFNEVVFEWESDNSAMNTFTITTIPQ